MSMWAAMAMSGPRLAALRAEGRRSVLAAEGERLLRDGARASLRCRLRLRVGRALLEAGLHLIATNPS